MGGDPAIVTSCVGRSPRPRQAQQDRIVLNRQDRFVRGLSTLGVLESFRCKVLEIALSARRKLPSLSAVSTWINGNWPKRDRIVNTGVCRQRLGILPTATARHCLSDPLEECCGSTPDSASWPGTVVCIAAVPYRSRDPEANPLYGVVVLHLETFLTRHRSRDRPVPRFVARELRSFLDCGVSAHGFLRGSPRHMRPCTRTVPLREPPRCRCLNHREPHTPLLTILLAWYRFRRGDQESPDLSGEVNVSSQIGSRERPGEVLSRDLQGLNPPVSTPGEKESTKRGDQHAGRAYS
jgi:hypothetical protein